MTNEAMIRALAELDGWRMSLHSEHRMANDEQEVCKMIADFKYLTSYDAIIPLIQKQGPIAQYQMVDFLCELMLEEYDGNDYVKQSDLSTLCKATPSQLCEALLRATGKWIE